MQALQDNADDANDLVNLLLHLERDGQKEYQRHEAADDIGLKYVFFVNGARELSERCGEDVGVIDSTHHFSQYSYKLITFPYVDSELRSRPTHFALTLQENVRVYNSFFNDVLHSSRVDLPTAIFSDQASSIIA